MDKKQEASVKKLEYAIEEYFKGSNAFDINGAELDNLLWNTMELFQSCPFHTAKGLDFTYRMKGNELFITRKSKSITKSSVMIAFHKALELGGMVSGPKNLGLLGQVICIVYL